MKLQNSLLFSILFSGLLFAADSPIELPSSVPLEVHTMKNNQIGIGYIQFSVNLELEDSYYEDKIGDIKYDSKGLIYTEPRKGGDSFLGNMFELSYTTGYVTGEIKKNIFTDNGKNYNNTYEKSGFYIGIRPSFNRDIISNEYFVIKHSTTLHTFLYSVRGDFSVNDSTQSYSYDESNYGIAFKPTTVLQGTYYPIKSLGLTVFGGLSTFVAADWVFYDGKDASGFEDEDNELGFLSTGINPVFGYDISYNFRGDSIINLSSVISKRESDNSSETVLRYIYTF